MLEFDGQGFDTVVTSANYTLGGESSVEILSAQNRSSTIGLTLSGNELSQTIAGTSGADTLNGAGGGDILLGFGGNDTYVVGDTRDVVVEQGGEGNDTVVTSLSYALGTGQEMETLAVRDRAGTAAIELGGNDFSNTLGGNAGNNLLSGGGGADVMLGFGGDDIYVVKDASDVVVERSGEGRDTIYSFVSYVLAAGQEVEVLSTGYHRDTAAIDLVGNSFGQTVYGNFGDNRLDGGAGADTLIGFGGSDTFVFSTALGGGNLYTIQDFEFGQDRIALDRFVFTGLAPGVLDAGAFRMGSAAQDGDDLILYDAQSGALLFDSDGIGAGAAIQFAQLQTGLMNLSAADFLIF